MASFDSLVNQKIKLFESVPDKLATAAIKTQAEAWKKIRPILDEMDVDAAGNIEQTENNVRRIGLINEELKKVLAGSEYKEAVKSFLDSIDKGVQLTDEIAINAFYGSGLDARFTQPFLEQLTANVAARAPLREAVNALEGLVVGTEANDGRILANIKTTATTAQAVADRSYSAAVNEELDIQWYEYLGGEIDTTRPFCRNREDGIYHKKEIEAWGDGKNSAGINDIRDGTWAGRIEGTDSRSIFTFVGGWNCRHYLVPVPDNKVPDTVKARARAEGYID
jgi:hypothetical protein